MSENYEDDYASEFSRPSTSLFSWPPPPEDHHEAPTASPLYIPPPETQHVKVKPLPNITEVNDTIPSAWQSAHPSRSAPELTTLNLKEHNEAVESSSDSYTSTCTTTTTTSEEYQRMYQAHQQFYDQSASDIECPMDAEMAGYPHHQYGSFSSGTTDLMSFSGRRSVQECVESLSHVVDTTQLVKYLKDLTPCAETPPPVKPLKRVEFAEPIQKPMNELHTPIHEVKPLAQSSIPNHPPKEWKSEMVRALTTASKEPYHMSDAEVHASNRIYDEANVQQNQQICSQPCEKPCVKPCEKMCDKPCEQSCVKKCAEPCNRVGQPSEYSGYEGCVEVCEPLCVRKDVSALREQCQQVCDVSLEDKPIVTYKEPEFMSEHPAPGHLLSNLLTTASPNPVEWTKPFEENTITLPNETVAYFPPPISMKPYEKEDYGKKSPFCNALVTAPFRSFTPFDHDVITQLEDLPTPTEQLKLIDALTVAPTEPVHELNQELPAVTETERLQMEENDRLAKQAIEIKGIISHTIDSKMDQQLSAFAKVSGFRSVQPFQPMARCLPVHNMELPRAFMSFEQLEAQKQSQQSNNTQEILSNACTTTNTTTSTNSQFISKTTASSLATATQQSDQNHVISFPPPAGVKCKSYVQSGLHKPETIPKYQRQWFNLASQSPVRTPEPQELKENVPLAFIEIPHEDAHRPVAVTMTITPAINITGSAGPEHAQALQSTDLYNHQSTESVSHSSLSQSAMSATTQHQQHITRQQTASPAVRPRSQTPSLINKHVPAIPYYQQNLVAEECDPTNSLLFDPRVQSPMPDRCPSPAPGPPPNPLRIHAPRVKSPEPFENSRAGNMLSDLQSVNQIMPSSPSTKVNSYQTHTVSSINKPIATAKDQQMSHYQSLYQTGAQSYVARPEVVQQKQVGNLNVQVRSKESELNEAEHSNFESASTTQIGNTQVQRKTRVVEEFEHTQKAKSVEIYKSSGGGQARSITASQGVAPNFTSYKNNQQVNVQAQQQQNTEAKQQFSCYKSANNSIMNQAQSAAVPAKPNGDEKLGFVAREARRLSTTSQYTADLATYQSKFPQTTSPTPPATFPLKNFHPITEEPKSQTYNVNKSKLADLAGAPKPPPGYQQIQPNLKYTTKSAHAQQTQSSSQLSSTLTSSTTATAFNPTPQPQPSAIAPPSSYKIPTAIPVPAFKPPMSVASDFKPSPNGGGLSSYKPKPSSGPGFKPPNTIPSAVVSDPHPASAGPNKGLTFGATSAPKRGRGVLNNPGSGGRVPQCGCCNAQIR